MSQEENLAEVFSHIRQEDLEEFRSLGHTQTEAAFVGRKFHVVKTKGKTAGRPRPPEILGEIRVVNFRVDLDQGSIVTVMRESDSRIMDVGHVPSRLFDLPIFVSVPISQGVIWGARRNQFGQVQRSVIFGMAWRQQSSIKFFNRGNISLLTTKNFEIMFGRSP